MSQLPAVDVPPDGVKKWANSPVQKVPLVKAPNSAVPKRVDVEPYHLTRSPSWIHCPCQPAKLGENHVPLLGSPSTVPVFLNTMH